jgi:exonuclease SbcC
MRIKKIYIKNFKGIREKKIINFCNQTSLLIGPNGFGKTTIFDVLELCLTGKMNRTLQKGSVTRDTSDYKKPFYQNTTSEDVVVKVWLEKENGLESENLIITKFLSKDNDGRVDGRGRKYKPCDFKLLSTYREQPENFDNDTFAPHKKNEIKQDDIDDFFEFKSGGFKIDEVYNLFNYLQQEETTFFLKKSEKERKDTLSFLFHTSDYEEKLEEISSKLTKLKDIESKLDVKIDNTMNSKQVNKVEYSKLFLNKEFELDRRDLFQSVELNDCNKLKEEYYIELDKLSRFLNIFSPDENAKKQKIDRLSSKIKNNNLIEYYVLHELLEKSNYELLKKKRELLNDDRKLKAFILHKCILKYKDFKRANETYSKYEKFLKIKDFNTKLESMKEFVLKLKPEMNDSYLTLIDNRQQLISTTKEIDLSIKEIIRLRNSIKEELAKNASNIINDAMCPYCGVQWRTLDELVVNFKKREDALYKLSSSQTDRLIEYESKIKYDFIIPITNFMKEYLEQNEKIDTKIIELLEINQGIEFDYDYLKSIISTENIVWSKPKNINDLMESLKKVKVQVEGKINVSVDVFERVKELHHISFEADLKEMEQLVSKEDLSSFIIKYKNERITMNKVKEQSTLLKSYLETSKELYKYDYEKANDTDNYYEKYFDSQKDKFKKFEISQLDAKRKYIEYSLVEKQTSVLDIYIDRRKKLSNVIERFEKVKTIYNDTIKMHKKDMADKIKLPFYIYTAKILQNYQQGMGVFLSTKENSDSIRFLTDPSTDHDAMHHLSSGQLAVISLAFSLAINKTYNISKNLKILAIDDPVQEMDALNIHSFVELIRHEFLEEYQLIFSTHSDLNALYMKYKFEKIIDKPVSMINVQTKLFKW